MQSLEKILQNGQILKSLFLIFMMILLPHVIVVMNGKKYLPLQIPGTLLTMDECLGSTLDGKEIGPDTHLHIVPFDEYPQYVYDGVSTAPLAVIDHSKKD